MYKIRRRSERRKEHAKERCETSIVLGKGHKEDQRTPRLLFALLAVRTVNIFVVRTSFVPDEYWQSLEVAYHYVYGLSHATWEWQVGLRSFAYPGVFALLYKVMLVLGIDNIQLHLFLPRLLQACLSALGDWYFYRFARRYFGSIVAKTAMFSLLMSWFWWYCATRTILQTAESAMLFIGFYYYPFDSVTTSRSVLIYQAIAVTVSAIRPTAAVVWVPMALWHIKKELHSKNVISTIFQYVCVCAVIVAFLASIDRLYYGAWVFVQWNFLHFNVITNQGVIFGRNPWYYYFTEGIPVVVGTQLLFFLHGLFVYLRRQRLNSVLTCCAGLFLLNICVYSCIGHKEIKFIIHLIPIAALFCGIGLTEMSPKLRKCSLVFLAVTNIPTGLYFGLIHQGGTLSIMGKLHDSVAVKCARGCEGDVLFLIPCYNTPLQSHLHLNVTVRMLACQPNLAHVDDYVDETDLFYEDPKSWLQGNVLTSKDDKQTFVPPHHIVIFDILYEELKNWNFFVDYSIPLVSPMKTLIRYISTYIGHFHVAHSSTMLFENVRGLDDRKNAVLCTTPSYAQLDSVAERSYEGHVVFFPGDVQNFEKSMQEQPQTKEWTAWSFEKVAKILSDKFPKSYVWLIAPSKHMYRTLSVFHNFVKSESLFGIPSHDDSHGGMLHLELLLQNSIRRLVDSGQAPPCHDANLLNSYSITLIGFSKGCIVLNQFLHEVASMQSSTTEVMVEKTVNKPSRRFLNRVGVIYWLDGGHSGEKEIWVTKREVLSCLRNGCWKESIKIFVHVTPYQIKDKVHPWKGQEEEGFVSALRELGIDFVEKVHFDDGDQDQDKNISLQKHFQVLEVF